MSPGASAGADCAADAQSWMERKFQAALRARDADERAAIAALALSVGQHWRTAAASPGCALIVSEVPGFPALRAFVGAGASICTAVAVEADLVFRWLASKVACPGYEWDPCSEFVGALVMDAPHRVWITRVPKDEGAMFGPRGRARFFPARDDPAPRAELRVRADERDGRRALAGADDAVCDALAATATEMLAQMRQTLEA